MLLVGLVLAATTARGASPLGEALRDIEVADHWIYDDLARGFQEAQASGKPLLVVVRCVPCPPGRTLDQQVVQPGPELAAVEKQFVCVRVIQANSLDLTLFDYDFDMSWSAVFMNADRTIYGRYGSRNGTGTDSDRLLSVSAFRRAAERALALHKNYPANRAQLAGKSAPPPEYKTPREIPGLEDKPAVATARQNCIHCHMVKDYALRAKWLEGRLKASDLWVYPQPVQVGMELDLEDGLKVTSVEPGSFAAAAGVAAGDELVSLGGQPLVSRADVQWVLHRSADEAQLPLVVRRGGQTLAKTLAVRGAWKQADIAWRGSSGYGLRQGLKVEPLTDDARAELGLKADQMALLVRGIFGPNRAKLNDAGLKSRDVIVAVDGIAEPWTETQFLLHLRLKHGPQDAVKFTVLHDGERKDITVPLW